MTRRPDELDPIARELERYAQLTAGESPGDLADRVMADVADEPTPGRGLLAWLLGPFTDGAGGPGRLVMVAGTMAAAVLAVVIAGQVGELLRDPQIGPSPSLPAVQSPTATPTSEPSVSEPPSLSPSVSPTISPTPSPSPTSSPPPPSPSPTDDDRETPEPSDDDHSGPGGGEESQTPRPSDASTDSGGSDDSD